MEKRQTKQRVQIVEKSFNEIKTRLYLMWYQEKKRFWESTKEFYFTAPKGLFEKQHNKDVKVKVDALRNIRENQLFKGEIEEVMEQRTIKNQDFTTYFEKYVNSYPKKDLRVMRAVLLHFKEFAPQHVTAKEITEKFCFDFKDYLSQKLNGESPSTYFARFKKMIRQAKRDKIFKDNPTEDIKNIKTDVSITKDVLTIEELQILANTHCGNAEVKRAFLFCCNTGLRFVDVKALQWKNIEKNVLKIEQSKTKEKAIDGGIVEVTLNDTAIKILGTPTDKDDLVFKLPSHGSTVKSLDYWAKRGGIEKHITFHCARHTFGTLLAYYESDIITISKLLGHTSLKHTSKYIRTSNEMKQKAVNSIPTINF
ncbi:MAG: site-specific integrase [Bacteroidota bacterium]